MDRATKEAFGKVREVKRMTALLLTLSGMGSMAEKAGE